MRSHQRRCEPCSGACHVEQDAWRHYKNPAGEGGGQEGLIGTLGKKKCPDGLVTSPDPCELNFNG